MKRKLILPTVLLVLAGIMLACFSTKARVPSLDPDEIPVILTEIVDPFDPNAPRTPVLVPISCSLDSNNDELNFTFLFPMGDVAITLTEATAGVVSSNDYSTSLGLVTTPVPYTGTYDISIVLTSGVEYIGSFVY